MDREDIERTNFPVGRRGYDQASVDAHLRAVADEFERVGARSTAAAPSLSAGTSEHVRLILEAAERSAAELREDAGRRAGDHVGRVGEAAEGMLRRLDDVQAELTALLEGLRASGRQLADGLAALQQQVEDVGPRYDEGLQADPGEPPVLEEDFAGEAPAVAAPEPAAAPAEDGEPADEAGARITALNMALGGSPREETAAYLAEHYALPDPEALLDDVYAKAASEAVTRPPAEAG